MDFTYGLGLTCALVALAAGGYAMVNQTIAMIAHRRWSAEHDRPPIWNSLQLYSRRRYREVATDAERSTDARKASRAWRRALFGSAVFIAMLPLMYLIVAFR